MISKQYSELFEKYKPLSIKENTALLHQYVNTHSEQIAWKLVCHNARLIYKILASKYTSDYITDELFSDALLAFYEAIRFYKKEFNYHHFMSMAGTIVIGKTGYACYKRRVQVSGDLRNKNNRMVFKQVPKDKDFFRREDGRTYKYQPQEDFYSHTPFEEVANKDMSEFCCGIINGRVFRKSLTITQKRGLEVLLQADAKMGDAGRILGVSRQRIQILRKALRKRIKKTTSLKEKEIKLILS